ncbi:tyrosine-type recombinase/integrase [Litoribacillus peritrichatus]|uniref:Tyr recombinase domain-containing protein n=1 Tax=Litoribacillus peritrichatus TaxID=718191 RepID=A0ABP7MMX5_9GAMM
MPLPPVLEKNQRDWLFKVSEDQSEQPERDLCLLGFFLGTPCTTLEINRIQLGDVLEKSGRLVKSFVIRGSQSFNGLDRKIYLSSKRLKELIQSYLGFRVKQKIGLGSHPDYYLSLNPEEPLFFTNKGDGYSIVSKVTPAGKATYSPDALDRHLKQLMRRSGVENPSKLSGRRTFAVNLKRLGYDVAHIHHLLGNRSLKTTTKLLTTDPVNLSAIVANAF